MHPVLLHQLSHTPETPCIRTNMTKLMFGSSPPSSWSRLQDKRKKNWTLRLHPASFTGLEKRSYRMWFIKTLLVVSFDLWLLSFFCYPFGLMLSFDSKRFHFTQRKVDNSVNFVPEMTSDLFNVCLKAVSGQTSNTWCKLVRLIFKNFLKIRKTKCKNKTCINTSWLSTLY